MVDLYIFQKTIVAYETYYVKMEKLITPRSYHTFLALLRKLIAKRHEVKL